LHHTIEMGYHQIANILLKSGADPNIKNAFGQTSSHVAKSRDDEEMLEMLVLNGADVTIKDNSEISVCCTGKKSWNSYIKYFGDVQSKINSSGSLLLIILGQTIYVHLGKHVSMDELQVETREELLCAAKELLILKYGYD